jgi:hypothetical protein
MVQLVYLSVSTSILYGTISTLISTSSILSALHGTTSTSILYGTTSILYGTTSILYGTTSILYDTIGILHVLLVYFMVHPCTITSEAESADSDKSPTNKMMSYFTAAQTSDYMHSLIALLFHFK